MGKFGQCLGGDDVGLWLALVGFYLVDALQTIWSWVRSRALACTRLFRGKGVQRHGKPMKRWPCPMSRLSLTCGVQFGKSQ